jgi:uncharacterized FlaG/YvyC family protein
MSRISPISQLYNHRSSAGPKANSGTRADLGYLNKFDRDTSKVREELDKTAKIIDSPASENFKKEAVENFYAFLADKNIAIRFEFAPDLDNELIVKLVRKATGEVVMQFPPDRSLKLQRLAKYMPGVFFENRV